ncbi:hypothetical protein PAMP_017663 [Pampus punctatissimus]
MLTKTTPLEMDFWLAFKVSTELIVAQRFTESPAVSPHVCVMLYNKDAIIEYLLDKSAERPNAEAVAHIRAIKDIKELNLTDNPEWEGERRNTKGDRYEDIHCGMFICPVVGLEMNGKHRFCYLQTCGCVFSDRALKEVKTEICHKVTSDLFSCI